MLKKTELQLANSTYYVQARLQRSVVLSLSWVHHVQRCLQASLRASGCSLLAYCLLPDEMHLVLHSGTQGLASFNLEFSLALQNHRGQADDDTTRIRHWHSLWVDEKRYLKDLVHHVHHLPAQVNCQQNFERYPASSHTAYLRPHEVTWIDTSRLLKQLTQEQKSYVWLMRLPTTPLPELLQGNHQYFLAWVAPEQVAASYTRLLPVLPLGLIMERPNLKSQLRYLKQHLQTVLRAS
ncbi:MAG: hypothetical protein HKM02_00045 [Pseudomonadales bacterium]|nr:hypothetical protein [Pseudomonadales bacterium]